MTRSFGELLIILTASRKGLCLRDPLFDGQMVSTWKESFRKCCLVSRSFFDGADLGFFIMESADSSTMDRVARIKKKWEKILSQWGTKARPKRAKVGTRGQAH